MPNCQIVKCQIFLLYFLKGDFKLPKKGFKRVKISKLDLKFALHIPFAVMLLDVGWPFTELYTVKYLRACIFAHTHCTLWIERARTHAPYHVAALRSMQKKGETICSEEHK